MTIDNFLGHLAGVKKGTGNQWMACCPAHDDKHQSLSVGEGSDGRILVCCQAGCSCHEIVTAMGLNERDLFNEEERNSQKREVVETYDYGNGTRKVRCSDKSFYWQHLDEPSEQWSAGRGGAPHALFVKGEIFSAEIIFVVEGEKDVVRLNKETGCTVVCSEHGATKGQNPKWYEEYNKQLQGKKVYVLQDHDTPGHIHAVSTCNALVGTAKEVFLLDLKDIWPEIPDKADISDLFDKFGTEDAKAKLRHLMKKATVYNPESSLSTPADSANTTRRFVSNQTVDWNPLIPRDRSDVGEAEVFAERFADSLRYSPATGWLVYDSSVWKESEIDTQMMVQNLTTEQLKLAKSMLKEAQQQVADAVACDDTGMQKTANDLIEVYTSFKNFIIAQRKSSRIKATMTEARPKMQVSVSELDRDPFLLNTPGGIVDLRTGNLGSHNPANFCTKITAVSPGEQGIDLWSTFLDNVTSHNFALVDFLQELAGMFLCGNVWRENLTILYGHGGNGKSTLINTFVHVMGTYSGGISSDILITNSRQNKGSELAELRGRRLVVASELGESTQLDTGMVKRLCSTDDVRAEPKFKQPFSFSPSHSVVLCTNHLPTVTTLDFGTWSRLLVVPFRANFRNSEGERLNYAEVLVQNAGPAVLSWMIDGAVRYIAKDGKIDMPTCVDEACQDYREQNDWFHNFLSLCCIVAEDKQTPSKLLYDCYADYCKSTHTGKLSQSDFRMAMQENGFLYRKTKACNVVIGVAPKTTESS